MLLFPKQNRSYIYLNGQLLTIGKTLDFTISKIVEISDSRFFVFTDNFGDRYLVPIEFYESYKFFVGQQIKGWIDKINCMGRIYVEPFHPVYVIGEKYFFDVLHFKYSQNSESNKKIIFIVKDVFGNELEALADTKPQFIPESVECKIDKIKKGKLFLSVIN